MSLSYGNPHIYWDYSVYFLISDCSVLPLDTKREEGIQIDPPNFITHYFLSYGNLLAGRDISSSEICYGGSKVYSPFYAFSESI